MTEGPTKGDDGMADQTGPTDRHPPNTAERRAAHERLSTGGLARWRRACATHPWRVVLAWVGIVAGLIVLVATIGGSLKDEFSSRAPTPRRRPT